MIAFDLLPTSGLAFGASFSERQKSLHCARGEEMILRRLTENLRLQNWTAISIEFVIVVIGVFVGTQVSNWNQERLERSRPTRCSISCAPKSRTSSTFSIPARVYYRTTKPFAAQALAGWAGDPKVSDSQFVIAAYQASQIYGIGINAQNWALTFGGETRCATSKTRGSAGTWRWCRRPITNRSVSARSLRLIASMFVRVIPNADSGSDPPPLQRPKRSAGGRSILSLLPPTCPLKLDPGEAARAAAALRARRELASELNWHLAAVANYLTNIDGLESTFRALDNSLKTRS